jgi:hypothetical protein
MELFGFQTKYSILFGGPQAKPACSSQKNNGFGACSAGAVAIPDMELYALDG